jgi:dinuclear metal center YbgI/SA1388 family protein
MAHRDQIIQYLNDYLKIDDIKDYCPVGLQVEGKAEVHKIVTAVSVSAQLFQEAYALAADMIMVHHGLFWDRDSRVIKGHLKNRLQILLQQDITLLGYHLALDKHPVVGNNAQAAQALGLQTVSELGEFGVQGHIEPMGLDQLVQRIETVFQSKTLFFDYGPQEIRKVGFCSGGAEWGIQLAIEAGLDAYITGEAKETTMHHAKENGIHFISAGHYATERLGIRTLGEHLAQVFPVNVRFIDIANPV